MTFKEKRDHKFKILFMYYATKDDIDSIISKYFDNYPYDDEENQYINGKSSSHTNVASVILNEDSDSYDNESDKAIKIILSEEDNIIDIKNKIKDIISKTDIIDEMIKENLVTWDINRVGKSEITIIRLAIYEMYFDAGIELAVAINEAVELAKAYGDDKASKFVNGVLATIHKNRK